MITNFHTEPPEQGAYGRYPEAYLIELPFRSMDSIQKLPGSGREKLNRDAVRKISQDAKIEPLIVYACIMAWGGRDFGNFRRSLQETNAKQVARLIEHLRGSKRPRAEDFEFTQKAANGISGLGISFYTKLLFFLREKPDAYILDQWTAKSATVLFPELKIRLTAAGLPYPKTSSAIYEAFCTKLEACCGEEGWGEAWKTGDDVERTIFDRPRGRWRTWLKAHLGEDTHWKSRSNSAAKHVQATDSNPRERAIMTLSEHLRAAYLNALNDGLSLPETCGRFAKPNRLHVRMQDGLLFQFILNKNEIRAQIFMNGTAARTYSKLVTALNPAVAKGVHDFGGGIIGNGPARGKTRAIDLAASVHGGWGSREEDWPAICKSAVEAMAELFGFFEPYL